MKIGISCYPTFGGSGVVASELGMGLAERGHEVHFITYAVPGRLDLYRPGIYYHEVTVPDYPLFEYPPYSLALASKMAETASRVGLDLIHAHYAIPHAASALLARDMMNGRLKVVTTLHGTDITLVGRDPSFLPITRHSIEASDAVTAVSTFLKHEVCRTFTCDKAVEVIYNFIDPRDYTGLDSASVRSRFAQGDEKLLVHISNFRPVKRVLDVVDIFLRVRNEMPVKLLLIGAGPDLHLAEEAAHNAGAEDDLVVLGNLSSVAKVLMACDLLLLPSQTESFGLAALEAMACGVPVIATDVGGLPEVITNGETGYLCPVGDVNEMAGRALELLRDEGKRLAMGEKARRAALERFNIDMILDQYEGLYNWVLSNGKHHN
jgi:N-acetyl-alpha-D-glucosaminyl L-malate synthase BshA